MNERIRELAAQCWEPRSHPNAQAAMGDRFNTEKFSELIIRECIGCCERAISDPVPTSVDTWLNGGSQCIVEIKEHFGVKE